MSVFGDVEDHLDDNVHHGGRSIKDPIHNYIPVSTTLSRFIDTKQFQRLRNIKQLGTTAFVWPGASHTRFEHSLGVAHLARTMATHLQKTQKELEITDRDVNCVELAGLCHDLGHGPWSHVWDGVFIPKALNGRSWKHEDGSEMMFDYLVRDNQIPMPLEDQEFIKALISGEHSRTPKEKAFLFDIVANKRNGLDVDKFDYIHRDSHMIGEPIHLSLARFVTSARVINNEICYAIKDANNIYEMGQTRFKLHKLFYNHKTAVAIELMIIDALLAAEPFLRFAEDVFKPERFLHLTDYIMARIEASKEPELAESRAILNRIHSRELYKCVDYKTFNWHFLGLFEKHVTAENIVEAAQGSSLYPMEDTDVEELLENASNLKVSDVEVCISTMHYGKKEKNVLDFVKFYSKNKPNESMTARPGDYSNLMPQYFAEHLIRIYTKKPEFFGLVQVGYRAILAKMKTLEESQEAIVIAVNLDTIPTPPQTEAPSTPRALSRHASLNVLTSDGSASTPFSNNSFTTVLPSFVPASPTQATRRLSGNKRTREEEATPIAASKRRR